MPQAPGPRPQTGQRVYMRAEEQGTSYPENVVKRNQQKWKRGPPGLFQVPQDCQGPGWVPLVLVSWAAIAMDPRLGSLKQPNVSSHRAGGQMSEIKVSVGPCSLWNL